MAVELTQKLVRIESSDLGSYEETIGVYIVDWLVEAAEETGELLFTHHCPARCFGADGTKIPRHAARNDATCIISVHRAACCWERSEQ